MELVFSPLSREALGSLVYHILKAQGPVPVGEIGKSLQEITNNNNITDMIKTEFKGLKKLIEMCPEYFSVGTEHPFNPIVTVRPDAKPYFADLSYIISSLLVSFFLYYLEITNLYCNCCYLACCVWSLVQQYVK